MSKRQIIFFIFSIILASYSLYIRFENPHITETELFLKMIGL